MNFLELAIVGAAVSAFVQFAKNYLGTNRTGTIALVIMVSLGLATGFYFLVDTRFWPEFLKILATASTIYGVLIKPFEK